MSNSKIQLPLSKEALFSQSFEPAYELFIEQNARKQDLKNNKTVIFNECRKKIKNEEIDDDIEAKISKILKQTLYSCASIPETFIGDSDLLEPDVVNEQTGEVTDLNRVARNIFRYIERGTEVDASRDDIKKGLALLEKALGEKRDPKLTCALREEFQKILNTIALRLQNQSPNMDDEKQYEILISNLLAAYTFFDPHEDTTKILSVPQKIDGQGWCTIDYQINPLDLSPQTGLMSKLLRPEDRIYAYGLTPREKDSPAQSHLLLMGTIYPTGQGSQLSNLHKFDPRHSVGEAYDWVLVESWIKNQRNKVKVTGHSQGGSSAMFVAASYPSHVSQADCLNPPALCTATINHLNPRWLKIPKEKRPQINVYTQAGDPVYPLENGFFEGTRIFRIISGVDRCSTLNPWIPRFFQKTLETHLHHFAGRESSIILELDAEQEGFTHWREFYGDIKAAVSWTLYPFLYSELIMGFALRNLKMWCLENLPQVLTTSAAVLGFIPYYALNYALSLTTNIVKATLLVTALLLTAMGSGIKIGLSAAFGVSYKPQIDVEQEETNPSPFFAPI